VEKTRTRRFPLDLALLSGSFFFIFLGPGALQQHLDKVLGDKRFYVLATVYLSFCFWRIFIATTMDLLGDRLSEVLGAATYVLFAATMLFSTSWPAVLLAALVWGWGASSLWITSQSQLLDTTKRYGAASGLFYSLLTGGQALGVGLLALVAAYWDAPLPAILQGLAGSRAEQTLRTLLPSSLNATLLGICIVLGLPGLLLIALVPQRKVERQRFSFSGFWKIASQRTITLVGIILLCSSLSYGILLGVFSEIARNSLQSQWPAIGFYAARVVLCFPAGALADKIGKERVLKLSFLIAGLGVLVAALWRSSPGLSLTICAIAMATENTLTQSNSMALMGDVAKSRDRHLALGAIFLWRDLGIVIPLFLAGALKSLLPNPQDTEAVGRVFHASLFGFAAVFFLCAFLTDALRKAVQRQQAGGASWPRAQ